MSGEHVDVENLRTHCERMAKLLADPHPGLMTWRQEFYRVANEIRFELDGEASCVREVSEKARHLLNSA